jgi:uncharacterized protein (DUF2252 family)
MSGITDRLVAGDDWTAKQQRQAGVVARKRLSRRDQATYEAPSDRDPVGILVRQNSTRDQSLVGLRMERMLQDEFAFYRGSAALQAADLAASPDTGAHVVLCGDAHLDNFGIYTSPDRRLVFDINDFDEGGWGPWEWDVKRLVTSAIVAGRRRGMSTKASRAAAAAGASGYRYGLQGALELDALQRHYVRVEVHAEGAASPAARNAIQAAIASARKSTSASAVKKLMARDADGVLRFVEDPPVSTHLPVEEAAVVDRALEVYRSSVPADVALLLSKYRVVDVARRAVGVGSLGTRCYVIALAGPADEPLVLQVKEAGESVLSEFGRQEPLHTPGMDAARAAGHHGYRVVCAQRILQAVSDPFLGDIQGERGTFYVRQLRDGKASLDHEAVPDEDFGRYVALCGRLLGRAHAQSPDADFIGGYVGTSDRFDQAMVAWGEAYAAQVASDFEAVRAAHAAGSFSS